MNINVEVGISRTSRDEIHIRVQDKTSRAQFVDVCMTPADFTMAITGLYGVEATAEVRGLDVVGKKKITENRSIECPLTSYDKKALGAWLEEHGKEDGWEVNTYLGSQTSVTHLNGKTILNYSVTRYE